MTLRFAKFIVHIMLMIPDAVSFSSAHFGAGVGAIFLDNVACSGSESNLLDCPRSWAVSCYRGHREDAGVRCQGRLSLCSLDLYICAQVLICMQR